MEIISDYEIKRGIEIPEIIQVAYHTHYAWCEELERQKAGWGTRYLPWELIPGSKKYEADLRVRVAAILAVLKELNVDPTELRPKFTQPLIRPADINRGHQK